mmetsp:Transcript_12046/g.50703  ORF Transcript_12046/g.50703 Transcript_12046/m.50703 type:complete len:227 (+) Transcript_12046:434-1114(+)
MSASPRACPASSSHASRQLLSARSLNTWPVARHTTKRALGSPISSRLIGQVYSTPSPPPLPLPPSPLAPSSSRNVMTSPSFSMCWNRAGSDLATSAPSSASLLKSVPSASQATGGRSTSSLSAQSAQRFCARSAGSTASGLASAYISRYALRSSAPVDPPSPPPPGPRAQTITRAPSTSLVPRVQRGSPVPARGSATPAHESASARMSCSPCSPPTPAARSSASAP